VKIHAFISGDLVGAIAVQLGAIRHYLAAHSFKTGQDVGTARALLQLINLVVERRIATQKRIEEMFGNLPSGALEQIQKRDGS
jgi:hypothetical protein